MHYLSLFRPCNFLFWEKGVVFGVAVDTISASDNGKEFDDPCFMHYEAA